MERIQQWLSEVIHDPSAAALAHERLTSELDRVEALLTQEIGLRAEEFFEAVGVLQDLSDEAASIVSHVHSIRELLNGNLDTRGALRVFLLTTNSITTDPASDIQLIRRRQNSLRFWLLNAINTARSSKYGYATSAAARLRRRTCFALCRSVVNTSLCSFYTFMFIYVHMCMCLSSCVHRRVGYD